MRISPPGSKRGKLARSAWRHRDGGTPICQFPDTFATDSPTGCWESIIVPELGRKMESQMIDNALGKTASEGIGERIKNARAGNGKRKAAHRAGKRLRPSEQDASRKNAPRSKVTGDPLCWDSNSHAGCRNNDCGHIREKCRSREFIGEPQRS